MFKIFSTNICWINIWNATLEVSVAVWPLYGSLAVKGIILKCASNCGKAVPHQPFPNTGAPLTTTVVKTDMQYLHSGNPFLFAHANQNILKANVAPELPAVLVYSRKVLGFSYEPQMEYFVCKGSNFSSVPQDKRRHSTLYQNTTASFHIISQFFLIIDLIFRRFK